MHPASHSLDRKILNRYLKMLWEGKQLPPGRGLSPAYFVSQCWKKEERPNRGFSTDTQPFVKVSLTVGLFLETSPVLPFAVRVTSQCTPVRLPAPEKATFSAMMLRGRSWPMSHPSSSSLMTFVFLGMCSPLCEVLAGTLKNSSFLREMCNSCVFGLIFLCFLSTQPVLQVIQFLQPRQTVVSQFLILNMRSS